MDQATALAYVKERCAAVVYPTLSDPEVLGTLRTRYTTWAANTTYSVNDIIIPTTKNGHQYRCVHAGTTGPTEPVWTAFLDYLSSATGYNYYTGALRNRNVDLIVGDGTLQWKEDGPDYQETYDVRSAISECWRIKATKVSADFKFATDLQVFEKQQVYMHCVEQAQIWAPQRIV